MSAQRPTNLVEEALAESRQLMEFYGSRAEALAVAWSDEAGRALWVSHLTPFADDVASASSALHELVEVHRAVAERCEQALAEAGQGERFLGTVRNLMQAAGQASDEGASALSAAQGSLAAAEVGVDAALELMAGAGSGCGLAMGGDAVRGMLSVRVHGLRVRRAQVALARAVGGAVVDVAVNQAAESALGLLGSMEGFEDGFTLPPGTLDALADEMKSGAPVAWEELSGCVRGVVQRARTR